jgi:hypothetical protein
MSSDVESQSQSQIENSFQSQGQDQNETENPPEKKIKLKLKSKYIPPTIDDNKYENITLTEIQKQHVQKIKNIFLKFPVCFDLSMLGSGKTYTSSFISKDLNFNNVIVICPANMVTNWQSMKDRYGIKIKYIESFKSISSIKCSQPKHGLLERYDYNVTINSKIVNKVKFKPTEKLKQMVNEGTLLIIDEIQNIKNINASFHSCEEIVKCITAGIEYGSNIGDMNKSRVIFLSGSPIDKLEQVIHLFRYSNIMKSDDLSVFIPYSGINEWRGFKDIMDLAYRIDRNFDRKLVLETNNGRQLYIPSLNTGTATLFKNLSYEIFQKIFKPNMSCSMNYRMTGDSNIKIINYNALYEIRDTDDAELLSSSVHKLMTITGFNRDEGTIHMDGLNTFKKIITSLISIETAKISTMVRIAEKYLTENLMGKMVICVSYTETINDLELLLKKYNPLILNGSVSMKKRKQIRDVFQGDNDNRLLISNLKVCSTGIDLDDKFGNRPRFCLVNPNYSTIDLYQLCYRFLRLDTKSSPTIHILYGRHACELSILKALSMKGSVMKDTINDQVDTGIVFPCDFPFYDELNEKHKSIEIQSNVDKLIRKK